MFRDRRRETEIRESHTEKNTNRETQERESRRSRMGKGANWLFIGTLGMYVMSWREACLPSLVYTEKWPCDTHCGALLPHTHLTWRQSKAVMLARGIGKICWWIRQTVFTVKRDSMRHSYHVPEDVYLNSGVVLMRLWCFITSLTGGGTPSSPSKAECVGLTLNI